MSYNDTILAARDEGLVKRFAAAAAGEGIRDGEAFARRYALAIVGKSTDIQATYAYAVEMRAQATAAAEAKLAAARQAMDDAEDAYRAEMAATINPGTDPSSTTDAMILAAVHAVAEDVQGGVA